MKKRIEGEQVSPEAVVKFLKEKKSVKNQNYSYRSLFMYYFLLFMSSIVKQSVAGVTLA